jgi:hypothetical protein
VQRLRRLACAIWQLADALNDQQPGEIASRALAALSGEIEHYVGRLAAVLGLRWAGHVGSTPTDAAEDTAGAS